MIFDPHFIHAVIQNFNSFGEKYKTLSQQRLKITDFTVNPNSSHQSVSGESMTKRIFIFLAAGDPRGGKLSSSFGSFRCFVGEFGPVEGRSLSREGRRLLKLTPPEIFNFCKNSMVLRLTALEFCRKCLKV